MKGFKKLFLGLVFMALFGVGFRVEVKAAELSFTGSGAEGDWNSTESKLNGKLVIVQDTDTPDAPETTGWNHDVYTLSIIDSDGRTVGISKYIAISTCKPAEGAAYHTYGIGDSEQTAKVASEEATGTQENIVTNGDVFATRSDVLTYFSPRSETSKNFKLHLQAVSADPKISIDDTSITVPMYKVSTDTSSTPSITYSFNEEQYLLPGESTLITATNNEYKEAEANTTDVVYKYSGWTDTNSKVSFSDITSSATSTTATVTMNKGTNAGATTVKANYLSVSLKFEPKISVDNDSYAPGDTSSKKTITFTTTGDKYTKEDVDSVTIGGSSADWSWTGSKFTYTVPSDAEDGEQEFRITMKDGNSFYAFMDVDNTVGINAVQVTLGMSVPLSRYITEDSKKTDSYTVKSLNSYVIPDPTSGAGNKIYLTGNIITSGVKDLVVNGDTDEKVTVVVYRQPEVWFTTGSLSTTSLSSTSTTSSSSSSSSAFKVIMPTHVYYGDSVGYAVDTAGVDISGSRGTRYATLKMSSDSSVSGGKSATADLMSVTSLLKDVCSRSNEYIEVRVYPVNPATGEPDENVYDYDTILVHRINLDGSEGATYKVNDKDVGDYFYALDGVDYKITASNKSGYSSTIEKWEGVSFGTSTSGTASFRDSQTVKAFFKSNSSTSSSSSSSSSAKSSSSSTGKTTAGGGTGTGGDYDDVPKTGESKTDIWILWSVLFISILGAGFMIYKRFGLVKAIARAEEEAALVEREERVEAEKKEKKEKMDLLKSLRNL